MTLTGLGKGVKHSCCTRGNVHRAATDQKRRVDQTAVSFRSQDQRLDPAQYPSFDAMRGFTRVRHTNGNPGTPVFSVLAVRPEPLGRKRRCANPSFVSVS